LIKSRFISLKLAHWGEFVNNKHIKVIVPGGQLKHDSASLVGPDTSAYLSNLRVNTTFLGASSLSIESGLGEDDPDEIEIKKTLMKIARTKILVADTAKWERLSLTFFAGWNDIHAMVTDSNIPEKNVAALQRNGLNITIADRINNARLDRETA